MRSRIRQNAILFLSTILLPMSCQSFSVLKQQSAGIERKLLRTRPSYSRTGSLAMSDHVNDDERGPFDDQQQRQDGQMTKQQPSTLMEQITSWWNENSIVSEKRPPMKVDDTNLLYFDVFLIINLIVSISYMAVHRLQIEFLGSAFSEGCLMSIFWVASGLYTGAFLYSAVDGHYASGDDRAGPKAAGLLGFQTYINAINLRLVFALLMAVLEHRPVGMTGSEQLIPLEIGFGLILLPMWRTIHSSVIPRL